MIHLTYKVHLFLIYIILCTAEDLKLKWKNIRDNYARNTNETRKTKSGSEAKYTKKYAYADMLSFLVPVVKKRK